jgi:hypothetical protein
MVVCTIKKELKSFEGDAAVKKGNFCVYEKP